VLWPRCSVIGTLGRPENYIQELPDGGFTLAGTEFWLPLSRGVGITEPAPCPDGMSFSELLVATSCDWRSAGAGPTAGEIA
jgi:hypothetical protein